VVDVIDFTEANVHRRKKVIKRRELIVGADSRCFTSWFDCNVTCFNGMRLYNSLSVHYICVCVCVCVDLCKHCLWRESCFY